MGRGDVNRKWNARREQGTSWPFSAPVIAQHNESCKASIGRPIGEHPKGVGRRVARHESVREKLLIDRMRGA